MKNFTIFNQLTAMPKRLAMVLTVLFTLSVGSMLGAEETSSCPAGTISNNTMTWDLTSCTIVHAQASSANFASYSPWRVYQSTTVTFTPKANVTISKIVITATTSDYATAGKTTWTNASAISSGSTLTVTPTDGSKEIKLTASKQTRWSKIVITYTAAASCDNEVKVVKGTPSNGSFSISKTGTYETCDEALVITLSNITPDPGFQFDAITQSGINTSVAIDQANKTVTYAQNSSGNSTINVTFVELPKYTVTWKVNGTEYNAGSPTTQVYDGGKVTTLPTAPDPNNYCGQVFAGWTTTPIDGATNTKPSSLFTTVADSPEITYDITFYAVFADYANQ